MKYTAIWYEVYSTSLYEIYNSRYERRARPEWYIYQETRQALCTLYKQIGSALSVV